MTELAALYRTMVRVRRFEVAVGRLWDEGRITGEMHVGTGEEAVAAGVVAHLGRGDSLSLTHRCSPFLVARRVPLVPMLREMLGRSDGLCGGNGGHMHLFSREHRVATSGIVGASLPTAAGFALAIQRRRQGSVSLAQTGDGAVNEGMALETMNLAVAWRLPMLVVCIDNGWAITTPAGTVTGGALGDRARAFGWMVETVDGTNVEDVHAVSGTLIERVRRGRGPAFLLATSPRMSGHYLGDKLVRVATNPLQEGRETVGKVLEGATSSGGGVVARAAGLARMVGQLRRARAEPEVGGRGDPLTLARRRLQRQGTDVAAIDADVEAEISQAVQVAIEGESHGA